MNQQTTGGGCPLCGQSYGLNQIHGYGYCVNRPTYFTAPALTEADIRRIIREELERVTVTVKASELKK